MRRRHLRTVSRIESKVYSHPWSLAVFLSEIVLRSTRAYYCAFVGRSLVGYVGMFMALSDGHVTTLAVDPEWQRRKIATRLLAAAGREAISRGAKNLTLEVRVSNLSAQALYRQFGFRPVGVRRGYYAETKEDALVMWAEDVDQPEYLERLVGIEGAVPGVTIIDTTKRR
ncbi:MAG: ribosomal protein S18-alanine N-acetyltransferase [Acidimicrobiia bacterium]